MLNTSVSSSGYSTGRYHTTAPHSGNEADTSGGTAPSGAMRQRQPPGRPIVSSTGGSGLVASSTATQSSSGGGLTAVALAPHRGQHDASAEDFGAPEVEFATSDIAMATGQTLTPAALGDRERLMHERRLMAYHNTRLVLALQQLGRVGDSALEGLQHRASVNASEDAFSDPRACRDCIAAQVQMNAMDRTVARASLFVDSAREQLKVLKEQRTSDAKESQGLRASLLRCEELMRVKDAEIAALRSQVHNTQPAVEELLALRRTQNDLIQRIRVLQSSESAVRVIRGRGTPDGRASLDTSASHIVDGTPSASTTPVPASVVGSSTRGHSAAAATAAACVVVPLLPELAALQEEEEAQRVAALTRFFAFHNLTGILWRTEGALAEERSINARLVVDTEAAREDLDEVALRLRHAEIELRSEKTRSSMLRKELEELRGLRAAKSGPAERPSLPLSPPTPPPPAAPARDNKALVKQARDEAWGWALDRVQGTLDDAMVQIQAQIDDAFAQGYEAARADMVVAASEVGSRRSGRSSAVRGGTPNAVTPRSSFTPSGPGALSRSVPADEDFTSIDGDD